MALFAPTMGPTTVDRNILNPYEYELKYDDADAGGPHDLGGERQPRVELQRCTRERGPVDVRRVWPVPSVRNAPERKGPVHLPGRGGAHLPEYRHRVGAYLGDRRDGDGDDHRLLKGLTDLLIVLTSDSIKALPLLMVLILVVVVFQRTWLAELYDGAALLTLVLALVNRPYLWRAVRGPALQVAEATWIDAARSFGQSPAAIMRKHMTPYIVGYMMVYTSMSLGEVIIAVAGLTFLGLGINPPTPEWGRAVSVGQPYVATASWHISLLPGILITLVVTGFNALGDGIRDAIDPESEGGA